MPTETTIAKPTAPLFDDARLAIAGFLARYSGATRISYATDLRQFFAWCAQCELEVFAAKRGHIELNRPGSDGGSGYWIPTGSMVSSRR